ncbi:MAG TPA: Sec-independent protein translocase subunit TatA [Marmoricola sp.]|nr:Sec-independent protein translocase subunit TatA [Marmoricola sp.]
MGLAPAPLLLDLGPQELWILLAVVVLIFGAKKLPELARGSGQALRIFKAETKELKEADKAEQSDPAARATTEGVESPRTGSDD